MKGKYGGEIRETIQSRKEGIDLIAPKKIIQR